MRHAGTYQAGTRDLPGSSKGMIAPNTWLRQWSWLHQWSWLPQSGHGCPRVVMVAPVVNGCPKVVMVAPKWSWLPQSGDGCPKVVKVPTRHCQWLHQWSWLRQSGTSRKTKHFGQAPRPNTFTRHLGQTLSPGTSAKVFRWLPQRHGCTRQNLLTLMVAPGETCSR